MTQPSHRRLPVGAEVVPGGADFRVWAPDRKTADIVLEDGSGTLIPMRREAGGYFRAFADNVGPGALYKIRLDGGAAYPDPASRFQPEGPHNASQVVDYSAFSWSDDGWGGLGRDRQILYEIHVGTFTPEGTWAAAARKLEWLRDTGITAIEVMPVNEFPGSFGWGYDGVQWYAPTRLYGTPDDFRAFVDGAHALGIGVILDVVYNHVGPDGNYLGQFTHHYFTEKHKTDWGCAINYDGENCGPVREFVTANAAYWIGEFHLDGLRLDATQNIYDDSPNHILKEIGCAARRAAGARSILLIAENEPQHVKLVRPHDQNGYGLDMLWNDDLHHSAMVAMTGRNEAYYTDYFGKPQEFISAAKYGYLYQGQWYMWQDARRGTPAFGLPRETFVNFTQNHDQIANSPTAARCVDLTGRGTYKAVMAYILLAPGTPMLFQGQEFGASTPFYYFADHKNDLAKLVRKGRREFMLQFRTASTPEMRHCIPDPADPDAFRRCVLDWGQAEDNAALVALHRDLIRLRRTDATFGAGGAAVIDGAVLGPDAFVLRYFGEDPPKDRLLIVNLGRDLHLNPAPEPLLAPPEGMQWDTLWSSEDPRYGGCGTPVLDAEENWRIPGKASVALEPTPRTRPATGGNPLEPLVRRRNIENASKSLGRADKRRSD